MQRINKFLLAGDFLSACAAALHIAIIIGIPPELMLNRPYMNEL